MADKVFIKETLKKIFEKISIVVDGTNILDLDIIKEHLNFLFENYDKENNNVLLGFHTGSTNYDFAQGNNESFYKARFPNGSDCYNLVTIYFALFHNLLCNYSEENQKQRTYEYIKDCFDNGIRTFRWGPQLYTFTKVSKDEIKGESGVTIPNPDYNKLRPAFGDSYNEEFMKFLESTIGLNLSYFPLKVESSVYLVMDHNRFMNDYQNDISVSFQTGINSIRFSFKNLAYIKAYNSRRRNVNERDTSITSLTVSPQYDESFVTRRTNSVLILDENIIKKYQEILHERIDHGDFKNLFLGVDFSAINMVDFLLKYENVRKFIPCKERIEEYRISINDNGNRNEDITINRLISYQIDNILDKTIEESQFVIRDSLQIYAPLQDLLKRFSYNKEQTPLDKDFQFIARSIIKTIRTSVCKPSELMKMREDGIVQSMFRETYTPSGRIYDSLNIKNNLKMLKDSIEGVSEQYKETAEQIEELINKLYLSLANDDRKIRYLLEKLDIEENEYNTRNEKVKDNILIVVETRAQKQITQHYIEKYKDTLRIDVKLPNEVNFAKYYKIAFVMGLVNCWDKKFNIFTINSISKIIVYFFNFEKPTYDYYGKYADYKLGLWTKDEYWPKKLQNVPEQEIIPPPQEEPEEPEIPEIFIDGSEGGFRKEDYPDNVQDLSNVKWYVEFTDGSYAFLTSNYRPWVLYKDDDGNPMVKIRSMDEIEAEDVILFKENNNVNLIDEIIQNFVNRGILDDFMSKAYECSKLWKQKLRDFKNNNPFIWSDNVAANRIGRGINTIEYWLSDECETMAPGNNPNEVESTIRNIGAYIGDRYMKEHAHDYAAACLAFQDWHEKTLKSTLKKVIISQITENEETDFTDDNDRKIYLAMLENMKKTTVACEVSEIREVMMRVTGNLVNRYISR